EPNLVVYRPTVVAVWSVSLGFILVAVILLVRPRLSWLLPMIGVLFAAALLVASPLTWLIWRACLGLVGGGLAQLVRPSAAHDERRDARGAAPWAMSPTAAALLLGLCGAATSG